MSLTRRLIGLAAVGSLLISPALVTPSASAEPVEPATAPKTHTVEVGIHPFDVAIAQNLNNSGSYAFVANSVETDSGDNTSGALAAINTKTYNVSWRVKTGSWPQGMAMDRTRSVLYIPNYDDATVTYLTVKK